MTKISPGQSKTAAARCVGCDPPVRVARRQIGLSHSSTTSTVAPAQYKIRVCAEAIARVVADWVSLAYAVFEDYRMGGVTLSSKAVDCVRRMLKGELVTQETSGMSEGEWREFEGVVG